MIYYYNRGLQVYLSFLYDTSEKMGISCPSFRFFYCTNVWRLWTVFCLWNFGFG